MDRRRTLRPDEVVLGIARPSDLHSHEALPSLLSEPEKRRLERFRFEPDRVMFLVARALVRLTLSRCADVRPEAWRFRTGTHGRPEISHPPSRLRFSLSHTKGLAACAVILERDIGLDVEALSREPAIELARRFFSAREADQLARTPIDGRATRFLEYWTLKEAYVKARGLGLSLPLDRFSVYNTTHNTWGISFEAPLNDDPARWWLRSFRVGATHQAALAIG
jgi:4'-phosphopantetheinyl transferase